MSKNEIRFSEPSGKKAHGIDLLTLREALDTDWKDPFVKFGLAQIEQSFTPLLLSISTEEGSFIDVPLNTFIYSEDGKQIGTGVDVCNSLVQRNQGALIRTANQRMIDDSKILADIPSASFEFQLSGDLATRIFVRKGCEAPSSGGHADL
jgi:hypothetical protein